MTLLFREAILEPLLVQPCALVNCFAEPVEPGQSELLGPPTKELGLFLLQYVRGHCLESLAYFEKQCIFCCWVLLFKRSVDETEDAQVSGVRLLQCLDSGHFRLLGQLDDAVVSCDGYLLERQSRLVS
jgi:hypothetical protein